MEKKLRHCRLCEYAYEMAKHGQKHELVGDESFSLFPVLFQEHLLYVVGCYEHARALGDALKQKREYFKEVK